MGGWLFRDSLEAFVARLGHVLGVLRTRRDFLRARSRATARLWRQRAASTALATALVAVAVLVAFAAPALGREPGPPDTASDVIVCALVGTRSGEEVLSADLDADFGAGVAAQHPSPP